MTKYEVILYWSNEDEAFIAEVPELAGCAADGATRQEALANVESAINLELANKCARGDYYYGPFTTSVSIRKRSDPAIFEYAYNVKGWAIKCTVFQDDVPHVKAEMQVLEGMKQIQRPLIAKYLGSLRKR